MKFTEWGIPWECSQTYLQAILYYKCIDIGRRNSSSGSTSPAAGCPISKFHCHGFVLLLAGILHLGLELSPNGDVDIKYEVQGAAHKMFSGDCCTPGLPALNLP